MAIQEERHSYLISPYGRRARCGYYRGGRLPTSWIVTGRGSYGTDKGGLTKIFNDLGAGGQVKGPLTAQPGGSEVGWLMDKFGINWMVSIDKA